MQNKVALLNADNLKNYACYCWEVLCNFLQKRDTPPFPSFLSDIESPVFISWHNKEELKGCIGTFEWAPLSLQLKKYTILSSQKDQRFPPITSKSLCDTLECQISLLYDFEYDRVWNDWTIGLHGIIIYFVVHDSKYQSTFLPDVPQKVGSKEENMKALIRKAGYIENHKNILPLITLTRYKSKTAALGYQEYITKYSHNKANSHAI